MYFYTALFDKYIYIDFNIIKIKFIKKSSCLYRGGLCKRDKRLGSLRKCYRGRPARKTQQQKYIQRFFSIDFLFFKRHMYECYLKNNIDVI